MAKAKVVVFLITLILASLGAFFINPTQIQTDALSAICTIFSVLAGLILAIYALHISSIDSAHNKSNPVANAIINDSRKAVDRLSYFFWLYLIVLSCSLAVIISQYIPIESKFFTVGLLIVTRLTIFFTIFAAGMSFFVPLELKYIQERKILESRETKK